MQINAPGIQMEIDSVTHWMPLPKPPGTACPAVNKETAAVTFYVCGHTHTVTEERAKSYPVLQICELALVHPNNAIVTLRRHEDLDLDPYSIIDIKENDDFTVMRKRV